MRISNCHSGFPGARWILLAVLLGGIAGCAADREPGELFGPATEAGTLVIDALLIVDRPMPDIFVRQVVAPGVRYDVDNRGVRGASVEILQGDFVHRYREEVRYSGPSGTIPVYGRYVAVDSGRVVQPGTSYELTVRSGEQTVTGTTTTPGRMRISRSVLLDESVLSVKRDLKTFVDGEDAVYVAPENQVNYLDGLLEAWFDPLAVQAYQVAVFSLDLDSERVLDVDWLDEEDYEDLERQESSPPFEAKDGKLRLPWFAIYFGGRHLIRIYALDDNWFDFIRSSPDEIEGGGFGGLAGDNFERPIFHLDGGIGLFGSASVDSIGLFVLPKK